MRENEPVEEWRRQQQDVVGGHPDLVGQRGELHDRVGQLVVRPVLVLAVLAAKEVEQATLLERRHQRIRSHGTTRQQLVDRSYQCLLGIAPSMGSDGTGRASVLGPALAPATVSGWWIQREQIRHASHPRTTLAMWDPTRLVGTRARVTIAVTGRCETPRMAFGQQQGRPASRRQLEELLGLIQAAGHIDFRDARGAMGLTQRQAAGRFTSDEAAALIDQLQSTAPDADTPPTAAPAPRLTAAEQTLRRMPAEQLAAELQRRGWIVMEP
jgi:hypothetical protein